MTLCFAYWIKNILAGRATQDMQLGKRPLSGTVEMQERTLKQRTEGAGDVSQAHAPDMHGGMHPF
jgi:hypothetical protein